MDIVFFVSLAMESQIYRAMDGGHLIQMGEILLEMKGVFIQMPKKRGHRHNASLYQKKEVNR